MTTNNNQNIMKTILTCIVCLLALGFLQSQEIVLETISSGGNDYQANEVQLAWNLGENCIQTWTGTSTILSEGFYQDFDLLLPVENNYHLLNLEVYPNPLTHSIQLNYPSNLEGPILYRISDINGRKHLEAELTEGESRIDCSSLKEGGYLLSLYTTGGQLQAIHKIIKTKK
jgi:hypothetical protein